MVSLLVIVFNFNAGAKHIQMTSGIHLIIYSTNVEADKAFFRDVLKFTSVDIGNGWLIFGLPPSELAVHPSSENNHHEIFLMCDDIKAFGRKMKRHRIACSEIEQQRWGSLIQLTLPGGGNLGVYQPNHARPKPMKLATKSKLNSPAKGKKRARSSKAILKKTKRK